MKKLLLLIVLLAGIHNTQAQLYAKASFQLKNSDPNFEFYIYARFYFGSGIGPRIQGYQTKQSNDTLYIYGFYDFRGFFAAASSYSLDTFRYELKTPGINYFTIATCSYNYCVDPKTGFAIEDCNDTTWNHYDSTFSIHPSAIQNFEQANVLSFYPNPVSNLLHLQFRKATSGLLQIFSIDGRMLRSREVEDSEMNLDLSNCAPGVYLIQLTTADGSRILDKFVKE